MVSRYVPGLALLLAVAPAAAEEGADPLRFGNEDRFVAFSPFLQLDGGWASSHPRDLLGDDERREGSVRRARIYTDFGYDDFGGRLVLDFATPGRVEVPYAFIDYAPSDAVTLRAGQQDVTYSFQELQGSRSALFAEDALVETLSPADAVGAAALYGADRWSLSGGVFGSDINRQPFDDGIGLAARATYAPYLEGDDAVHLGLGLSAGFDRQEAFSLSGGAGVDFVSASLVSTDDFEPKGKTQGANLELAATLGRFTLQSQYMVQHAEGFGRRGTTAHGGYLGALVFLTPDHRAYDAKSGIFEQIEPRRGLGEGGFGALEIGGRFDYLDLTDDGPDAGAEFAATAIANWYPTDQLRFTATHVHSRTVDGPDDGERVNATLLRAAFIY
ncbi:OprO/OprP family phosphate-selective porin [Aureimonas phyllosphaerae]|uniref:OprO/OprP family phosphate-selective porin n=1 Tax=Aureimonas phyllosphaerae TaxID=1166078 RepID=UPI003A5BAA9B